MPRVTRLDCRFFATKQGNEPVRDWLKELPRDVKTEIGSDVERVQWRWPASKPLVEGLGGGLYEVRSKVDRVNYRVLFCIQASSMVLLHGFIKKSRTAPDDLALGRARQRELSEEP